MGHDGIDGIKVKQLQGQAKYQKDLFIDLWD